LKLVPRVDEAGWPGWYVTAGRLGYATCDAELWRDAGEKPEEEAPGEWPEVYDKVVDGGVTAGVPLELGAPRGEGSCWGMP